MFMLAAAQADTTVIAAFAVGFISFVSPCVLPLVPGYLSAVSGVSIAEMRSGPPRSCGPRSSSACRSR
jgi:cytochrome c-type biogenesis protein